MDELLEATARAEHQHFWFRGFRRFVTPLLAEAVRGRSGAAILDCGCGTGHNLTMLRQFGRAAGIDLTASGLVYARRHGERSVAQASVVALPFADASFDLVTSFDVIYSLADDAETRALSEMFRVLRPGGHMVINVAAMALLTGNHSVLSGELRRYDRAGLARRLRAAGFEIHRLTYTNATIMPILTAVRLLQRVSGHRESTREISVPPAPVNATLSAVLGVEATALRFVNMPFGSSLLALARRPGDLPSDHFTE
jgi:ubiquinone/menaquinone biosynthesis C-methylase UbiE